MRWLPVLLLTTSQAMAESIGSPCDGSLTNGVRLVPDGQSFGVYSTSGRTWGHPLLVSALRGALQDVSKPRAKIIVNELSAQSGGEVPGHGYHESGRDVDIGFPQTVEGVPSAPMYVAFDGDGVSRSDPRRAIDFPRLAALILGIDDRARIREIVLGESLTKRLLEELPARHRVRAAFTLPKTGARPHDNHIHVQISCPANERRCEETCR